MLRWLLLLAGAQVLIYYRRVDAYPADSKACRALVDPSRVIECKLNDQKVECHKPVAPGTRAKAKCNTFYTSRRHADIETTCQSDGRWSHEVISCIPTCGEANTITPIRGYHYWWYLANKTGSGTAIEFPWHAGIYRSIGEKFQLICGGTIISERVIVTGATCLWNPTQNNVAEAKEFKVAVGKLYHVWYKNEENAQLPGIDRIIIHKEFRGRLSHWSRDIAVIKLKDVIQMTKSVRPICVDFNKNFDRLFTPGVNGVLSGWGGTDTSTYTEKLRQITLPYVDFETCEKNVPSSFLPYITNDKFCAGYLNGTSACPGDSGGGYATQFRDGKWYLMGILSVGVPSPNHELNCNLFAYSAYTRVSMYYDFISSSMTESV